MKHQKSDTDKLEALASKKDAESEKIVSLEQENKRLQKNQKEMWFCFIFIQILVIDIVLFVHLKDGLSALSLVVLELVFLLVIALKLDIEYIEIIFKRITGVIHNNHDESRNNDNT